MREARVGLKDDWDHVVVIETPKAGVTDHTLTPDSGSLEISYSDHTGTRKWWNGSAFTATQTTLATTINGTRSQYPYVHQAETRGRVLRFEGWVTRAGHDVEHAVVEVMVAHTGEAKLAF